jgi:hypothetical protein
MSWLNNLIHFVVKLNPLNPDRDQQEIEREAFITNLEERVEENVAAKIKLEGNEVILIEGIIGDESGAQSGLKTGMDILKKNKKISWSFSNVPKPQEAKNAKTIQNAYMASTIILSNKKQKQQVPQNGNNGITFEKLQKQIKCIECSIKKLELNLKLTNEEGIKDDEFTNLLNKISELCGNENGVGECETDLQEFVDEVILKRDMNSISGLIKLASFMCPILAFANKSLFSELAATAATVAPDIDEKTVGICSKIIGYITRSGNEGELTIEATSTEIDFIDRAHGMGVIEGIVSFVGANKEGDIEKKIKGSIRSVVRRTVRNTIETVLRTATFYQKTICMVFITLLSIHIYLSLCKSDNVENIEQYYKSSIELLYNNMTNDSMKIGFENETTIGTTGNTGGKKASKSRRAAKAAKPRATRASKATNATKAIAKVSAAKPKPKPTKSTPKKKK